MRKVVATQQIFYANNADSPASKFDCAEQLDDEQHKGFRTQVRNG